MMKKSYLIPIIIILIILIGSAIVYQAGLFTKEKSDVNMGTNIGDKAPDFVLSKMNGDEIALSSLRGQKVFLNFWASWCPPCQAEMPDIQKLYKEDNNIAILAVNIREKNKTVINYMFSNNYTFPVAMDKNGQIASEYLVRGIPTTYILDEDGIIMNKASGALSYEQMLEMLEIN